MALFGTIYSYLPNPRVLKIEAAAKLGGLEVARALDFVMLQTNESDGFKAKFHNTSVPAFETADGAVALSDSDAIAQFVAEKAAVPGAVTQLLGGGQDCPVARACVRQWIGFANDLLNLAYKAVLPRFGLAKYNAGLEEFVLKALRVKLGYLDGWLEEKEREGRWVAGTEKLSLADISLVTNLMVPFHYLCDEKFRREIPAVMAYFHRVKEVEQIRSVFERSLPLLSRLVPMKNGQRANLL